jgi:hypothetical protein
MATKIALCTWLESVLDTVYQEKKENASPRPQKNLDQPLPPLQKGQQVRQRRAKHLFKFVAQCLPKDPQQWSSVCMEDLETMTLQALAAKKKPAMCVPGYLAVLEQVLQMCLNWRWKKLSCDDAQRQHTDILAQIVLLEPLLRSAKKCAKQAIKQQRCSSSCNHHNKKRDTAVIRPTTATISITTTTTAQQNKE